MDCPNCGKEMVNYSNTWECTSCGTTVEKNIHEN
jgi:ribosomal protein S27AE